MDKNYWNNVFRVREEIFNIMAESGVTRYRCTLDVNPYYKQIVDNGGIGLEFRGGLPYELYTPLGYLFISGGPTILSNEAAIRERLISDYGVVMIEEEDETGFYGPIFAITRLPWADQELPIFKFKDYKDYIGYEEALNLYHQAIEM